MAWQMRANARPSRHGPVGFLRAIARADATADHEAEPEQKGNEPAHRAEVNEDAARVLASVSRMFLAALVRA